jgi:hypothetical protein
MGWRFREAPGGADIDATGLELEDSISRFCVIEKIWYFAECAQGDLIVIPL